MARRAARRSRGAGDIFTAAVGTIKKAISSPIAIIFVLLAIATYLTYQASPTDNLVTRLIKELQKSPLFKPLGDWLAKHTIQFAGFIILLPVVFANRRRQLLALILVIVLAFYVPQAAIWEYAVQSIILYMLMATNNNSLRLVLVGIIILAYFAGYGFTNILGQPPKSS